MSDVFTLRAHLAAPATAVYRALTDPTALETWLAEHADARARCRSAKVSPQRLDNQHLTTISGQTLKTVHASFRAVAGYDAQVGVDLAVQPGRQRLLRVLVDGHAESSSRTLRAVASRVRARNTRLATVPAGTPVMPPTS